MNNIKAGPKRIILVVDDNMAHRNLIEMGISEGGIECCSYFAANVDEARKQIKEIFSAHKRFPDLILLDRKLPGESGIDYLKELRADGKTASIPVVIMTASDSAADMSEAYKNGANSCLEKPLEYEKLIKIVRSMTKYWLIYNRHPG